MKPTHPSRPIMRVTVTSKRPVQAMSLLLAACLFCSIADAGGGAGPSSAPRLFLAIAFDVLVFLGLIIVCFDLWDLRLSRHTPADFARDARRLIEEHHCEQALILCGASDAVLTRACRAALEARADGYDAMREAVDMSIQDNAARFRRRISRLVGVAVLAPILGFLGTVLGWMEILQDPGLTSGSASPAGTLVLALGSTAAGLVVAAIARIAAIHIGARADRVLIEAEHAAREVIEPFRSKGEPQ